MASPLQNPRRLHAMLLTACLALIPSVFASPLAHLDKRQGLNPSLDFLPNETLPAYALQYAPYVYLYSQERYFPSDPFTYFSHVLPYRNYSPIADSPPNASTVNDIPDQDDVYLTAQPYLSDLEIPMPDWFSGDGPPDENGRAPAPALILAVDKAGVVGPGWVDVFYMFFYPWNQGVGFFGNVFGNHVGDWEQTMIRFANGTPTYIVPEAHGAQLALGAQAYTYQAIEKRDGRPVVYSANGTHGMYPVVGTINYTGVGQVPLYDHTDKGHLWDPTLNARHYFYSGDGGYYPTNDSAEADRVTAWLDYKGYWGDQQYNYSVINQTCVGEECFYVNGPKGPQSKSITRGYICVSNCTPEESLPAVLPPVSTAQMADTNAAASTRASLFAAVALSIGLVLGVQLVACA